MKNVPKTAFILGAGLGTRLRPLTEHTPKPLLPIGKQRMIHYALHHLQGVGVTRFIINTHHCAECYHQAFPQSTFNGTNLEWSHELILLDTGGGLAKIRDRVMNEHALWIYNADILCNANLLSLLEQHQAADAAATLLLRSDGHKCNVSMESDGSIIGFDQDLPQAKHFQFTGISIIDKAFFDFVPEQDGTNIFSLKEVWKKLIPQRGKLRGVVDDSGYWNDLGTLDEYYAVKKQFEAKP